MAQEPASEIRAQATVGSIGRVQELVLPGSRLQAKPMEDRTQPIVVRVVESYPHGDSHRYQLTFMALEPGQYDLRESLERVDGSDALGLPEILVEVQSVLAPGHIPPHQLTSSWPQVGSYRFWALLAVAAWVAWLLALIFWPKKRSPSTEGPATRRSLADLLRPRLEAAAAGRLDNRQLAELERWLVEYWRRQQGLEQLPPKEALLALRQLESSGPLLQQLERWLHSPRPDPTVSLGQLLEPYQSLTLSEELATPWASEGGQGPAPQAGGSP